MDDHGENIDDRQTDEYDLTPLEPLDAPNQPEFLDPKFSPISTKEAPFQFSLAQMFGLLTASALFLGLSSLLPREYAVGVAGLGVLVGMLVLAFTKPAPIMYLGWWLFLFLYLILAVVEVATRL